MLRKLKQISTILLQFIFNQYFKKLFNVSACKEMQKE